MKGANTIFCIDFDETLFNHATLNAWMDAELAKDGIIAEGDYAKGVDDYHHQLTPILRLYDHERHIFDSTGREWGYIAGHLKAKLTQEPCKFCYPDSHSFLRKAVKKYADVRILSFGHGEYQRFKMGLCAVLRELDLPTHIVDRPKGQFLKEHFRAPTSGILIDDKYPLDLPDNFLHVLVDRKGRYVESSKGDERVVYIGSLKQYKFGEDK
jgi:hypothetical protein